MTSQVNKFGWIPDVPDKRDYQYSSFFKVPRTLPPLVDLRDKCSDVENQGNLGSCTAQAIVGAMEFLEKIPKIDLSRLFLYYNERAMEGTINSDAGAMIRDGIKSANKQGVCVENKWPYVTIKFKIKPTSACYTDALKHQTISYIRINTMQEMKSCIADGYPVIFGFTVYESFMRIGNDGIMAMPGPKERTLGGHAVLAVGYDDARQCFIVRNSWGKPWGDGGYFYMPYEYMEDPALSDDFWTIRSVEEGNEPEPKPWWIIFWEWLFSRV